MTRESAAKVTLHSDSFWISPYVFAGFVALREKGVAFNVKDVHLEAGEQRRPEYRSSSWTGRVPALQHGDFWLTESLAVLEYVEETFPAPAHPSLFPGDRAARARARQLMSWLRTDETLVIRTERSSDRIFFDLPLPPLTEKGTAAIAKAIDIFGRFVTRADENLFGAWSIADAELAFFLHRLMRDDDLITPMLRGYAEMQWKRPSVAEYVAHKRASYLPYG
jgi:glutathione S-transferase